MKINTSLINFKKKHKNKKNQIIFHKADCKNNKVIENIINNLLFIQSYRPNKRNTINYESIQMLNEQKFYVKKLQEI